MSVTPERKNIQRLLDSAVRGDRSAAGKLLARHRDRLRQMIAVRMDVRLAARVDPSDIVQETLVEALDRLPGYLREQPLPFYPWLRQLGWERLLQVERRHLEAQKRDVRREVSPHADLSGQLLVERIASKGIGPRSGVLRAEERQRVRSALDRLAPEHREVLVLRYLEELSTREAAAVLGISESAVKMRVLRALQRIRALLGEETKTHEP